MKQGGGRIALMAAAVLLAGCAQFERHATSADTVDDDAYCRARGDEPGSPAYVACRKDRDLTAAQRAGSESRIERAHRNMAEDMLNHR